MQDFSGESMLSVPVFETVISSSLNSDDDDDNDDDIFIFQTFSFAEIYRKNVERFFQLLKSILNFIEQSVNSKHLSVAFQKKKKQENDCILKIYQNLIKFLKEL